MSYTPFSASVNRLAASESAGSKGGCVEGGGMSLVSSPSQTQGKLEREDSLDKPVKLTVTIS
jgi:hypothetical protein